MVIKVSLYTLPREALVVLIAKSKRVVMMRKNSA